MAVPKGDPWAASCLLGSLVDCILQRKKGKTKKIGVWVSVQY